MSDREDVTSGNGYSRYDMAEHGYEVPFEFSGSYAATMAWLEKEGIA